MKNGSAYVSMRDITKIFGTVKATDNMNLDVTKGEIHALLGENGAGKSTLMNMLSGIYIPDSGHIFIDNKENRFTSPRDAIKAGVGMIHQHFKLVEVLTALDNILLGYNVGLFVNKRIQKEQINKIMEKFQLDVDLDKYVFDMSVGEKQTLEILKTLYRGARILILDEPTAVLTPQETVKLFKIMRRMKNQDCSVIFISHKMNEVMEIADRVTVLRKGRTIDTLIKENSNPQELTELMVGRPVDLSIKRIDKLTDKVVFKVRNLRADNEEKVEVLKGINFEMYQGEILGVAGIAGSGQKELCEALAGLYPIKEGEISFKGEDLAGKNPKEFITRGISMSFIPEDRLGMGLVANMDMVDNILLKQYHKSKGFLVKRKPAAEKAKEIIQKLDVITPGVHHPIKNLSGGNIQKVLLGRELDSHPELLITAYPVRGLDINTCLKIYDILNEEKKKGVSILYIAEDLDSLLGLCDRIMVISNGEVTGIVDARKATKEQLGLMMLGNKEVDNAD
ncbi:MAG: ABC transporter ATP-binding protein [Gracilibacter sp. BRH_c7a]|nr:MAG: ABC transporter ATP-binding protein [Gracilibacter sp. BRH_c7a]